MRSPMTKRAFLSIFERQRSSGLSAREFCRNEGYAPANFYYWKGKFCSSNSPSSTSSSANELSGAFAPVRFSVPQRHLAPSTAEDLQESRNSNPNGPTYIGSCRKEGELVGGYEKINIMIILRKQNRHKV